MVKQVSVFLQNERGKIASITRALADKDIDIRALSIADTTDFGVLRMLVNDSEKARAVLSGEHCISSINEVTVVPVPDVPGGLANVLALMTKAEVDIEYMYSILPRSTDTAYMVFRVTDEPKLEAFLAANGIASVSGDALGIH